MQKGSRESSAVAVVARFQGSNPTTPAWRCFPSGAKKSAFKSHLLPRMTGLMGSNGWDAYANPPEAETRARASLMGRAEEEKDPSPVMTTALSALAGSGNPLSGPSGRSAAQQC